MKRKEISRGTMDPESYGDPSDWRKADGEESDLSVGKRVDGGWDDEPDWRDTGEMGG